MKKTLIALALMTAGTTMAMADEVTAAAATDTIACVNTPSRVIVVKNDSTTVMTVVGAGGAREFEMEMIHSKPEPTETGDNPWGLHLPFLNERGKRRVVEMTWFKDVYVGMLWGRHCDATRLSWECGFPHVFGLSIYPCQGGPEISLGFGFAERIISFGNGYKLDCDHGRLFVTTVPEGVKSSSTLSEFSLRVPLRVFQPIVDGFGLGVGVDAVFTTYARGSSKTKIDGTEYNETFKGLHQRPFRPELMGMIGWTDVVGLYVRYSPVSSFKAINGPSFPTISFGLTCNF